MRNTRVIEQWNPLQDQPREELSAANPTWSEGYADGFAAPRQSSPDARRGRTYCHGWLTGNLKARGFPMRSFSSGTIH